LLAEFDEASLSSQDIVEEVREAVRVADITEFHGLPAGPRVGESDAVIVVEGRSDVLTLLKYGVKNAIAVEGTDVPDEVARLTRERTVTAFLDGDRGGDLILKELAQVGDIDHVALAPPGRSVEDLSRGEVMTALRQKVPFEAVDETDPEVAAATDVESHAPAESDPAGDGPTDDSPVEPEATDGELSSETTVSTNPATGDDIPGARGDESEESTAPDDSDGSDESVSSDEPSTLAGHVAAVVGAETGRVRLLDADLSTVDEGDAGDAFELLDGPGKTPYAVVIDGELTQRVLDVAAQRGVDHVVAEREGEYVKQPTAVRVRTADDLQLPTHR
jgi:5S rRNA maturation endonuclease (ribonuclease M5)